MHGQTHQHANIPNPGFGVSGSDYEFFRAGLDSSGRFDLLGPLENDSEAHWDDRLDLAFANWDMAGLPQPWLFTSPHYAASQSAYSAMGERFPARLERVLYFGGEASGPRYPRRCDPAGNLGELGPGGEYPRAFHGGDAGDSPA